MPTYNQPRYKFNRESFERLQETYRILDLSEEEYEDWKEKENRIKACKKCGRIPRLYGLHENGMCNDCHSMRHTNK